MSLIFDQFACTIIAIGYWLYVYLLLSEWFVTDNWFFENDKVYGFNICLFDFTANEVSCTTDWAIGKVASLFILLSVRINLSIQPQLLVAVVRFDLNALPFDPCMRFLGFFHKLAGTLKFNGGKPPYKHLVAYSLYYSNVIWIYTPSPTVSNKKPSTSEILRFRFISFT
jgi:hypothetical protein